QHDVGHALGEAAEVLVLRDEVRLGVHLHDDVAVAGALHDHHALGGHTRGLLVGLRLPGFAQHLRGLLDVAACLDERLLAIHHPRASTLAELLDQCRFDFHAGPSSVAGPSPPGEPESARYCCDSVSAFGSAAASAPGSSAGAGLSLAAAVSAVGA